MSKFKLGDRVPQDSARSGNTLRRSAEKAPIYGVQPHDGGITTMDRHIVVFERGGGEAIVL